jgi:CRP/FNR family transcriptional regulator, cyclic AMP receptor protein
MHWAEILDHVAAFRIYWADVPGYIAALLSIAASSRKTMIPLRIISISTSCFSIACGVSAHVYPALILHIVLLPLNAVRLYQMLQLVEKVKLASRGDLSMSWLKPFMNKRQVNAGEVIFRRGDPASDMYYTVTGRYRLVEIETEVRPGEVIGELGLIAPDSKRTLTFACVESGEVLVISYTQVTELYFQNQQFAFYFLQLISQRLFRDITRLQGGGQISL